MLISLFYSKLPHVLNKYMQMYNNNLDKNPPKSLEILHRSRKLFLFIYSIKFYLLASSCASDTGINSESKAYQDS